MHKPNIIVFLLLGLAWVALIVSFGTYWYSRTQYTDSDNYTYMYISSTNIKYKMHSVDQNSGMTFSIDTVESWSDYYDIIHYQNQQSIFRASLIFAIIAWLILCVTLLFVILSLVGILQKIPIPLGIFTRAFTVLAFICCAVSVFVFLGLPKAGYKDCIDSGNGADLTTGCDDAKDQHVFDFLYNDKSVKYHQGPYVGWAAVVVASGFALIGSICSFVIGKF